MGAAEASKELLRIVSTAGLSKDIVDLLEKKVTLLTEKIVSLGDVFSRITIENSQLRAQFQNSQPIVGGFREFGGVLWKRTASGFENYPYCKECDHNPVMIGMPPGRRAMFWQCSNGHTAPNQGLPQ